MATTAIDTLRFARRPKDAGVPDAQAETMAEPVFTVVGALSPKYLAAEERTRFLAATRATGAGSRALDEEPDDGFPAAPGVAHRDQAAVRGGLVGLVGLVGVDPDIVAHPHARGHGVLRDAHDERLAARHRPPGSPARPTTR